MKTLKQLNLYNVKVSVDYGKYLKIEQYYDIVLIEIELFHKFLGVLSTEYLKHELANGD